MKDNAMIPLLAHILAFFMLLSLVNAQISYDAKTNHLLCSTPNTHYCAAASLQGSSIVSCYQSSSNSGDAVCAFNGTGYTIEGLGVNVPETVLCDDIPFFRPYAENINDDSAIINYPYGSQPALSIVHGGLGGHLSYSPISPSQHTATPLHLRSASTFTSRNSDADKDIICSNPWVRLAAKTADILTLNMVLMIPTPAPEIQSQLSTWISSTSSMPTSTTQCAEMSTTATPSQTTGLSSQLIPSLSTTDTTLTPYRSPTTDPEAIQSNMVNSANILHMGTVVFSAVWALMVCLVTLLC
ncbi:hypothetical protein BDW74DRAFT_179489 [Aspergillus multicolor]|uniref:uncharacterized protein n=1 Tax=Aspergillus multicolor TaxID=41759 RepID=UPI003CCD37E1